MTKCAVITASSSSFGAEVKVIVVSSSSIPLAKVGREAVGVAHLKCLRAGSLLESAIVWGVKYYDKCEIVWV